MIQRIQTVYLLLTTILSLVFLNGKILRFPGKEETTLSIGLDWINMTNNFGGPEILWTLVAITILIILVLLVSLTAIFFYKKRKVQMKLVFFCITIVCLLLLVSILYFVFSKRDYCGEIRVGLDVFILPLLMLFPILAYRRIRKDEELVRSYDRLR